MKANTINVHIFLSLLVLSDLVYSIHKNLPAEIAENHSITTTPELSIALELPRNFLAPTIWPSESTPNSEVLSKSNQNEHNLLDLYMNAISENSGIDAIPFMDIDFGNYYGFLKSLLNQVFQLPNIESSQLDNFFKQLDHSIAESGGYSLLDLDQYSI